MFDNSEKQTISNTAIDFFMLQTNNPLKYGVVKQLNIAASVTGPCPIDPADFQYLFCKVGQDIFLFRISFEKTLIFLQ